MFLGELPFVIKLLLGVIIYYIIVLVILKGYFLKKNKKDNSINSEEEFNNDLDKITNDKKHLTLVVVLSIILSFLGIFFFYYFYSEFVIIYLNLMLCQTVLLIFDLFDVDIDSQIKNLIVLVFSMSIMLYCKNVIDIKNIMYKTEVVKCTLIGKDSSIVEKPYVLIGKTKSFLFLYDKSIKKTKIIKTENFIDLEVLKRN